MESCATKCLGGGGMFARNDILEGQKCLKRAWQGGNVAQKDGL